MKRSVLFAAAMLSAACCLAPSAEDFKITSTAVSFLGDYVSRSWSASDGLPGNNITDVLQAQNGYMYFLNYYESLEDPNAKPIDDPGLILREDALLCNRPEHLPAAVFDAALAQHVEDIAADVLQLIREELGKEENEELKLGGEA